MSRLPLQEIPQEIAHYIKTLGGKPLNLYKILANNPRLLKSWLDFAYELRNGQTSRALREIMILRTAQLADCAYEMAQHLKMAQNAGVPKAQMEELANWQHSEAFNTVEKAALMLTEAIYNNQMTDVIYQNVAKHFDDEQMIELLLTASFYCMVPRFLQATGVDTQGEESL
ncbi:MAG: carboxymuconolactone decarboxylase family protein [Proteobacteria bacterium]|nr:carboxymuconolactone decarboxylase family protein [Pseudomonadota bacterium]